MKTLRNLKSDPFIIRSNAIFRNTLGLLTALLLVTACTKETDTVADKSLDQQKMEFQMRQLEIEKQKLAIEKEKIAYETQKKKDSVAAEEKARAEKPKVIRETRTVYANNTPRRSTARRSNSGTAAGNTQTVAQPQRQGMSKAAKGAIIGTVGGAAAGAIISSKNRGAGAVIGGVVGGATGYTIGRAQDRKDGRVAPR